MGMVFRYRKLQRAKYNVTDSLYGGPYQSAGVVPQVKALPVPNTWQQLRLICKNLCRRRSDIALACRCKKVSTRAAGGHLRLQPIQDLAQHRLQAKLPHLCTVSM